MSVESPAKSPDAADARLAAIRQWLSSLPQFSTGFTLEPLYDDASFRRYFRVCAGQESWVIMDAPPELENTENYVRISEAWRTCGINLPKVRTRDENQGFLMLDDFGDRQYIKELNTQSVDKLYGDALAALVSIQHGILSAPNFLPSYDRDLLMREMSLFSEWYLQRHLGIPEKDIEVVGFSKLRNWLADSALEQPRVWVHRDYHCRNLMITDHQSPGILDFQDAVTGPVTYDLVSLLRDCYIDWPDNYVREQALHFRDMLIQSSLLAENVSQEQFMQWFDLMGVQRHLKAIGIFARLLYRDSKDNYLQYIPRTWNYIARLTPKYPRLQPLVNLVERHRK